MPRAIAYLMGLTGIVYLFQGWVAGSEGFTSTQSISIVAAWGLSLVWMTWLMVVALQAGNSKLPDRRENV